MFKKLLVAVLALTIIIGLFSPALAAKGQKDMRLISSPVSLSDIRETAAQNCFVEEYDVNVSYYWTIPDAYGDDLFNMRFTNTDLCTLNTAYIAFYSGGTVGTPGATIFISHSDVNGFPDFANPVTTSIPLANGDITFDDWTAIDLTPILPALPVFIGDFNVGFTPIYNDPGDVLAIFSDDGSAGNSRSSEWCCGTYPVGAWGLMGVDWGADVNFLIAVGKCCPPLPCSPMISGSTEVPVADPNDQWPIWCHDFFRSSQSGVSLGSDICGIAKAWVYDMGSVGGFYKQIARTSPLVVDDKVYTFYTDRVHCIDLLLGTMIWTSDAVVPAWPTLGTLLSDPAIENGVLYMGMGNNGFMAVNAATGAVIWSRSAAGSPLEGASGLAQCSPAVILGNKVFFGNQGGVVYALDKLTGATLYYTNLTVTPSLPAAAVMMGSMSTDGTNLFIGTANVAAAPPANGCVYSLLPGASSFTQNWAYVQPPAILTAYPGGFQSAPSYRCDNLFINSTSARNATTTYSGFRQDLDPATGIEKWASYFSMGAARNAPVATIGTATGITAVFANYLSAGYQTAAGARGVRGVNASTNSTIWINPGGADYENHVYCHAAVTQDPWVFWGTADPYGQNPLYPVGGNWNITDGVTGAIFATYHLSGPVNGTAIAHGSDGSDYIVVSTQLQYSHTNVGTVVGSGLVLAFKDQGPRSRMVIPSTFVQLPPLSGGDPVLTNRTAVGAIENSGCMPLTYTATLSDGNLLPMAKISSVSSAGVKKAQTLTNSLVDYRVDDLATQSQSSKGRPFFEQSFEQNEDGSANLPAIKPAIANSARLAVPTEVTFVDPVGGAGSVPAFDAGDMTFQFDRSQIPFFSTYTFYVDINTSNDPDYSVEYPSPAVLAEIRFDIPYVYCPTTIEDMAFGDVGVAWANNIGLLGSDVYSLEFSLNGSDDPMFQGSMFYAKDMASAAWNPISGTGAWDPLVDGGFLFGFYPNGTNCGGCDYNTTLPVEYTTDGGLTYPALMGDICTYAMIDSGQDFGNFPNESGPSMGILIKYKEIGAYGPDFGAFKLTVETIINRYATPITGLYYGSFIDWDAAPGGNPNTGGGDMDKGYIYIAGATAAYGQIGLPSKGSFWPDGTKTDPMYNGKICASPDDYWLDQQFDSLYDWVDKYPEGVLTAKPQVLQPTQLDKAYEVAFGKTDLGPSGEHSFGFATFGLDPWSPTGIDNVRAFANKFAGFGRGDVDNNNVIDLRDLVRLQRFLHSGGPGPMPFKHLGDVNCDGLVNDADVNMMAAYFFTGGTPPKSTFVFVN